jgi:hypothetical protein
MAGTVFLCCSDHRRAALQQRPALNGIDYLEVDDLAPADLDPDEAAEYAALPVGERDRLLWGRQLSVFFVNPLLPAHLAVLKEANLRIEGGERPDSRNIGITVLSATASSLVLRAVRRGDRSIYRVRIIAAADDLGPPAGIDPVLAAVDFSFFVECLDDFDCLPTEVCPPVVRPTIDLDYLTRDYATFRRLMLDRIATLSPAWQERHAPDLGLTLVELVAYVADYLSYRQEAVATEAYLGTARKRVSVRRHARLVDYPMHDGCNARAWVQVVLLDTAPSTGVSLPRVDAGTGATTKFLTRIEASPTIDDAAALDAIATRHPEVFESMVDAVLYPAHNEIDLYPWGAADCCLPAGATRATLVGHLDKLGPGDVLVFEEVRGPLTGVPGDADPDHRQAVRLTSVTLSTDPLGGQFLEPPTDAAVDITEIEWSTADALLQPVCVSATVEAEDKTVVRIAVSVARGNVVPVDHGLSIVEAFPDPVPEPRILRPTADGGACAVHDRESIPARFGPTVARGPVTQIAPFDPLAAASTAMLSDVGRALPAARLESGIAKDRWDVRRDLLRSNPNSRDFVVETETDGSASVRFGDDRHGLRPVPGTSFTAFYRVGNGLRGNVGPDAIAHIATNVGGIDHVRSPLPAIGGRDPEPIEDVRRFAPVAFRTQERAVTEADYATMTERHPQVQRAAATFRWTGSWRTVFVTVDPLARKEPDAPFDPGLQPHLEPFRMAGHDLEVDTPRYVPLEVEMTVCAKRDHFRSDVKRALLDVFSSRDLADGRRGVFHPDNFTFGQPVYLSRLYAAAYAVEGVDTVAVTTFQRQATPDPKPLDDGRLEFGRLEIARLDNNGDFPERGVFSLDVAGGK